jgi:hypothetical protein
VCASAARSCVCSVCCNPNIAVGYVRGLHHFSCTVLTVSKRCLFRRIRSFCSAVSDTRAVLLAWAGRLMHAVRLSSVQSATESITYVEALAVSRHLATSIRASLWLLQHAQLVLLAAALSPALLLPACAHCTAILLLSFSADHCHLITLVTIR